MMFVSGFRCGANRIVLTIVRIHIPYAETSPIPAAEAERYVRSRAAPTFTLCGRVFEIEV